MRRRRHAMITPQAATTSDALLEALLDARRVELALLDDLTDAQMLGTRAHFVEPPIWEMGHVGWFQEYWLLRRLDGADPLLPGADDVYDSFNVSYTRRWDHRFPSRASTRAYITEVLRRSVARLGSREPRDPRRRSEEHTSELQSLTNLVCRLLLEKKKTKSN